MPPIGKIDVEGFEEQALRGMDFVSHRPWIVVVEATEPGTPKPSHHAWEPLLLRAGYSFAYFDGLNRFYVAEEHSGLGDRLAIPPNVFDEFETNTSARCREENSRLQGEVIGLRSRITAIENSRSWKITAPLRWLFDRLPR